MRTALRLLPGYEKGVSSNLHHRHIGGTFGQLTTVFSSSKPTRVEVIEDVRVPRRERLILRFEGGKHDRQSRGRSGRAIGVRVRHLVHSSLQILTGELLMPEPTAADRLTS